MSKLKDTLNTELRDAMVAKGRARSANDATALDAESVREAALKGALTAVSAAETSGKSRKELTDQEVEAVLRKQVKSRLEAANIYGDAGSQGRAQQERAEAAVLDALLPQLLGEEETRAIVKSAVEELDLRGAGPKGTGVLIKHLRSSDHARSLDMGLVARIAKGELE